MAILEWMEQTRLSIFINESSSLFGFAGFLCVHTLGLSLLAGVNAIVSVRMLGVAPTIPLQPLKRLFPYMWAGVILTLISGAGLAMARATVLLTNPILIIKLVLVVIGTGIMWNIQKKVFNNPSGFDEAKPGNAKILAGAEILIWFFVLTLGRLIAYRLAIFE
jgi:hypothetical protein